MAVRLRPPLPIFHANGLHRGFVIVATVSALVGCSSPAPPASDATTESTNTTQAPPPQQAPARSIEYRDLSPAQVRRARSEVTRVFGIGRLSALVQRSRGCYRDLTNTPDYGRLDFCVAFDAFAERRALDESGTALPENSYFAGTRSRGQAAGEPITGSAADAALRVTDITSLVQSMLAAATTQTVENSAPMEETSNTAAPASSTSSTPGVCWRFSTGYWRWERSDTTLNECVQLLFAGRCEPPGSGSYGQWGSQTLRRSSGRIETSNDGRSFQLLVDQNADCSITPIDT